MLFLFTVENCLFLCYLLIIAFAILGYRLMVGQRPLKPLIVVRIHVPQPTYAKSTD